jgi:hypothetical protein
MLWAIIIILAVIVIILAYYVWKMHKYLKWVSEHRQQLHTWLEGTLLPWIDALCNHLQDPDNYPLPGCGAAGRTPPPPQPDYP